MTVRVRITCPLMISWIEEGKFALFTQSNRRTDCDFLFDAYISNVAGHAAPSANYPGRQIKYFSSKQLSKYGHMIMILKQPTSAATVYGANELSYFAVALS